MGTRGRTRNHGRHGGSWHRQRGFLAAGAIVNPHIIGTGLFGLWAVETTSTHGTGCTFSSAIAASIARGEAVEDAVSLAKAYITGAIANAFPIGSGHGPLNHFHEWWDHQAANP